MNMPGISDLQRNQPRYGDKTKRDATGGPLSARGRRHLADHGQQHASAKSADEAEQVGADVWFLIAGSREHQQCQAADDRADSGSTSGPEPSVGRATHSRPGFPAWQILRLKPQSSGASNRAAVCSPCFPAPRQRTASQATPDPSRRPAKMPKEDAEYQIAQQVPHAGVQRQCGDRPPPLAIANQRSIDATRDGPIDPKERIAGEPGHRADDENVANDARQRILVDNTFARLWTSRRVLVVVESEFFNRSRRVLCWHYEHAAHAVIHQLMGDLYGGQDECPIGTALPIGAFIYDAQVFHQ